METEIIQESIPIPVQPVPAEAPPREPEVIPQPIDTPPEPVPDEYSGQNVDLLA